MKVFDWLEWFYFLCEGCSKKKVFSEMLTHQAQYYLLAHTCFCQFLEWKSLQQIVHFFYVANWASHLWSSTLCRREKCLWSTSFRHSYLSRKHKSLENLPYLLPFWWPISNNHIKCITEFLKMSVSVYVKFHLILYLTTFSCLSTFWILKEEASFLCEVFLDIGSHWILGHCGLHFVPFQNFIVLAIVGILKGKEKVTDYFIIQISSALSFFSARDYMEHFYTAKENAL